ncbi:MAG: transcriptional regulator [Desulfuromonadales bacterium]|jgi:transcriptional regulator
MTEPAPPAERLETPRERLLQELTSTPQSARALSQRAGLSERDVFRHLFHLQKSLKTQKQKLVVTPAGCLDCNFTFHKRARLTPPGKCPVCRSTHLSPPLFSRAD